ncbi:MAG: zinc ribbon domain-containing protein [Usitatibacteraceae bacterium]
MPTLASLTLCQYCEHANPVDAKFCAGCGAPLHLIPCPHCGAVNQKSSKSCYQCHGELRESTEILLASVPASAAEVAAGDAASTSLAAPYAAPPPAKVAQRQPLFVVAIILAAFAAAAYFAYQQRSHVAIKTTPVPNPSPSPESATPATASPPNLSAGAINKATTEAKPTANIEAATAVPAKDAPPGQPALAIDSKLGNIDELRESAKASKPASGTARSRASARAAQQEPVEPTASANGSRAGLEKRPPRVSTCTDSLAALGLCTPGPTKGN